MNPYQSPSEETDTIPFWKKVIHYLKRQLGVCKAWDCKEEFVMNDYIWFREDCTVCGKCRPWQEYRR